MDKGTLIRTIVLVIALINQFLVTAGLNPIPGDEAVWYEVITIIFTGIATATTWFKNNYVTAKGKKQKEVLDRNGLTK
ncbi:phage holin [Oceanobacillus sp. CF4.6]|uniref:phage holin n=1 Tax=Oceanobacillus sp. CF4.6 TaxID=3373080 RepID=UPI003EE6F031